MTTRILVVDDTPEVLDIVVEAMEADGHAVTAVHDGLAALDRLAETSFDVVITDLVMPGLSGLDVAESVKRTSPSTAVILLTAWAETAERARVGESPVDATVAKPFDIDDLRARATSALGKASTGEVGQAAGPRILLVEDDPVDLNLIPVMLGSAGCRVDTARSARHALALACARPYDLILLDCRASETEACKLSASLRQGAGVNALVPVVAISAEPVRATRDRYFRAGIDDVLPRPLTAKALSATVRRWARSAAILDGAATARLRDLDDGSGLLEGTIEKFLDQASQGIVALRAAATAGDTGGLAETARRLRRECRAMGALAMAEACRELEMLGEADSVVGIVALVDRLAWELNRARWMLQRLGINDLAGQRGPVAAGSPAKRLGA